MTGPLHLRQIIPPVTMRGRCTPDKSAARLDLNGIAGGRISL